MKKDDIKQRKATRTVEAYLAEVYWVCPFKTCETENVTHPHENTAECCNCGRLVKITY